MASSEAGGGGFWRFDLKSPGQREAIIITYANLIVSGFFWLLSIWDASEDATSSLIAAVFQSSIDLFSTVAVVVRLSGPRALDETPRNEAIENRTSACVSLCMVLTGVIMVAIAAYNLLTRDATDVNRLKMSAAVTFSLSSAIMYLVIGLLQAVVGVSSGVRSLRQDGVVSILAAVVSLGALLSILINLMTCRYQEYIDMDRVNVTNATMAANDTAAQVPEASSLQTRDAFYLLQMLDRGHTGSPQDDARIYLHHRVRYPFYFIEDLITGFLGLVTIGLGLDALRSDASGGVRWWAASFWCDALPPEAAPEAAPETAPETKRSQQRAKEKHESTPLIKA